MAIRQGDITRSVLAALRASRPRPAVEIPSPVGSWRNRLSCPQSCDACSPFRGLRPLHSLRTRRGHGWMGIDPRAKSLPAPAWTNRPAPFVPLGMCWQSRGDRWTPSGCPPAPPQEQLRVVAHSSREGLAQRDFHCWRWRMGSEQTPT